VIGPVGSLAPIRSPRWWLRVALAVVIVASLSIIAGLAEAPSASASASAPAASQCDPPEFPTGAGYQVTCKISIDNVVTATGGRSSTVTATACLAAAGVLPPKGCKTTTTKSSRLVTSVNQCNKIAYGGGSNVKCDVRVTNTVPTSTATSGVTVNQCNGSGTGGGTQPTVICTPIGSTTNATVTQCNGSGNGGGATKRVKCTVSGAETALRVTINQCNGSANGGGSTVMCSAVLTNKFTSTTTTTTTTTKPPTGTSPTGTTPSARISTGPPEAPLGHTPDLSIGLAIAAAGLAGLAAEEVIRRHRRRKVT
jgi:hypothetical protein